MLPEDFTYLNPYEEIRITHNRLPHWQQDGATYFLTFRQDDALPLSVQVRWEEERTIWMANNPEPWDAVQRAEYSRIFRYREERMLDRGIGSCHLRRVACRDLLEGCLMHSNGKLYDHVSWVIMPNHVHTLTSFRPGETLERLLQVWKGASSHGINRLIGAEGTFWQKGYRETIIRDFDHLKRCIRYIRRNPTKANLRLCSCRPH